MTGHANTSSGYAPADVAGPAVRSRGLLAPGAAHPAGRRGPACLLKAAPAPALFARIANWLLPDRVFAGIGPVQPHPATNTQQHSPAR